MTIDEAIAHAMEVAERQEISADDKEMYSEMLGEDYKGFEEGCRECAAEHRQLAEWLTDYKKSQEELAEAKRLLKLAICELGDAQDCDSCIADCSIGTDCIYKWHCSNEALKLIES